MGLIEQALARSEARPEPRRIDYDRMNKVGPKLKAQLTRAKRTGDPEKVAQACKDAMREWDACGAWPDNWSMWQRALDDALPWNQHIELEDLR